MIDHTDYFIDRLLQRGRKLLIQGSPVNLTISH